MISHILAFAIMLNVIPVKVVGRVVFENFLGVRADLGAYTSCNVLSHLFPVFAIETDA